jgi:hypothetical protein
MDSDFLASGLLSNRQLTRLASRGGRNRSSTRLPVLGRQLRIRGLAPAPFSISKASFVVQPVVPLESSKSSQPRASHCLRMPSGSIAYQKNERPLGAATARAWGWRVLQSEVSSGVSVGLRRSRAVGRHTGANRSQPLSYSRKPNQLPTTCPVCVPQHPPSIARRIHSCQYLFPRSPSHSVVPKYPPLSLDPLRILMPRF